ncbi:MAG TPA: SNF2-related protein [Gemmataceae bacterium]|jgi:superfamily II DNA or RNA helicase|nr:SNF2-related protein [Gemmataceae bacterium]
MKGVATSSILSAAEIMLEPGDRFAISLSPEVSATGQVPIPEGIQATGLVIESVEDEQGRPLGATVDAGRRRLILDEAARSTLEAGAAAWLEYRGPGRFRLAVERTPAGAANGTLTTEQGVQVTFDPQDLVIVRGGSHAATLSELELSLRAARLATHAGFDRLICLPLVRDMELLEHQIRTAKTVLRRFRGRALLCDEVGLGKTIEAGLVLDELHLRGLARSTLILVPPSLIEQWQGEMRRKFGLEFTSHDDPAFRQRGPEAWNAFDRVIASTHTAKREPHRSAILRRKWDMVIVDEAHHLRNRNTQLWKFASELEKQFILLLTATPVQNNLEELFNLVTLLEPGLLRTARQFQRQFVDRRDKLTPRNVDELHALLSEVMVRNRRSTVGLQFTRRWARTERIKLQPQEQGLYEDVTAFVRKQLRSEEKGQFNRMTLLTLQMALGSSSQAAAGTLQRLSEHDGLAPPERALLTDLAERAPVQAESSKADRLLGLLDEFPDKLVVFTQFRATQDMLQQRLAQARHEVAVFHGGLSRLEKEAAIERFRGPARVLLATEAGSEGRNLQFAHAVCNFDLPWNPMKIEQRIGRLSRIGQQHDVHVFNLVAQGTVEAALLHLLEAKLNMFELVIGEIDMILGNLDDEREFQEVVADVWAEAADTDDFARRMDELGNRLLAAKNAYFEQRSHDDRIFGDRFSPDS